MKRDRNAELWECACECVSVCCCVCAYMCVRAHVFMRARVHAHLHGCVFSGECAWVCISILSLVSTQSPGLATQMSLGAYLV
jgi:hypothetical protein